MPNKSAKQKARNKQKKQSLPNGRCVTGFIQNLGRRKLSLQSAERNVSNNGDGTEAKTRSGDEELEVLNFGQKLSKGLVETLSQMQSFGIPVVARHRRRNDWQFYCPTFAIVVDLVPEPERGRTRVVLFNTEHPAHFLFESNPRYAQILTALQESLDKATPLKIAIVDIERAAGETETTWKIVDVVPDGRPLSQIVGPSVDQFDESAHCEIPIETAQQIFDIMDSKKVDLDSSVDRGIPYQYVSSGCVPRAHEACRIIRKHGVEPFKIWIFSRANLPTLRMKTFNHPNGEISWSFHVAPVVKTREGFYVVDPATSDHAMQIRLWLSRVSNDAALTYLTSAHVFSMTSDHKIFTSDPHYRSTIEGLRLNRICLKLLVHQFGKPPYYPA